MALAEEVTDSIIDENKENSKDIDVLKVIQDIDGDDPRGKPSKVKYFDRTLLTSWDNIDRKGQIGSFGKLRVWMIQEKRIIVGIRSLNRIRSYMRGFLVAFDFHWNLALTDVDEFMLDANLKKTARKAMEQNTHGRKDISTFRKTDAAKVDDDVEVDVEKEVSDEPEGSFALNSTKYSLMQRFVKQIFIRGDNVVSIRLADLPKKEDLEG